MALLNTSSLEDISDSRLLIPTGILLEGIVWYMLSRVQIKSYIEEVHHLLFCLNCNS